MTHRSRPSTLFGFTNRRCAIGLFGLTLQRAQDEGAADPEPTSDDLLGLLVGFLHALKSVGRAPGTVERVTALYLRALSRPARTM